VWIPLNQSWDAGPDEFLRQFRLLPPEISSLYAAHWCQSEICNGGHCQFFSNTTGLLAPEARNAFEAIGARDWAAILGDAISQFGAPYPRLQDQRQESLDRLLRQDRQLFNELDDRFFEWISYWEKTADAYAEQFIGSRPKK
jgi:hypothetical protein